MQKSTQKPLTKQQLSKHICILVLNADPDTRVKVHDIRKYAASCALAETMDVSGMVNALQWKYPQTFFQVLLVSNYTITENEPTTSSQTTVSDEEVAL